MLGGKFLFTILGIVLAIIAICKFDSNKESVVEGWWGGNAYTSTAMPYVVGPNGTKSAFSGNYLDKKALMGNGKFVSVPSYQAILSPRFSNVQYGANILYNMPDRQNLAAPCEPLTFGEMAKEGYVAQKVPVESYTLGSDMNKGRQQPTRENYSCGSGQCGMSAGQSCGKGGYGIGHLVSGDYDLPVGYTNGNYDKVYNGLTNDGNPAPVVSQPCSEGSNADLPVGTMNTMDGTGNQEQFVMMNRIMTTNLKSRLRAQGDPIRGDLAVVPDQFAWFSVYPTINTDLQPGAMNVLAGHQAGESNAKLMDLLINSSGGSRTTYGGVDFSNPNSYKANMTPQLAGVASAASTDINFTSFP